jgi:hypothetical protein
LLNPAHRRVVGAMLLLVALTTASCQSETKGQKMVHGYSKTRDLLGDAEKHVDATIITMHRLRQARGDAVSPAFDQYRKAVNELEKEGEHARFRATGMKQEADAHIAAWQKEMETITDPAIKASLQTRRDAVRSNFKLVQMYADDVNKAYDPFIAGNKQMIQALSLDLSPAGLNSLSPAMDKINTDAAMLKQKLAMMQQALDNIGQGVSPIGH